MKTLPLEAMKSFYDMQQRLLDLEADLENYQKQGIINEDLTKERDRLEQQLRIAAPDVIATINATKNSRNRLYCGHHPLQTRYLGQDAYIIEAKMEE